MSSSPSAKTYEQIFPAVKEDCGMHKKVFLCVQKIDYGVQNWLTSATPLNKAGSKIMGKKCNVEDPHDSSRLGNHGES